MLQLCRSLNDKMKVVILAAGGIVVAYWIYCRFTRKKWRFPPGPKGLPLLGNALQVDTKRFASQMCELGQDYGDAYTVQVLQDKFVILNSYEIIKKVIVSPKYSQIMSGRPRMFLREYYIRDDVFLQTYSEEWSQLRRVTFRGLKIHGTSGENAERLFQNKLEVLIKEIQTYDGHAVDPFECIAQFVTSFLVTMITGEDHDKYDDLLRACTKIGIACDYLADPGVSTLLKTFPFLRHIPLGAGKLCRTLRREINTLTRLVNEAKQVSGEREACFLAYMFEEEKKGTILGSNIIDVVIDIIVAGTATTRNALLILVLILSTKPDVQEKIQSEIDREIGQNRQPRLEDKQRMPYTQAVLWEFFRLYTPVPIDLPRCTMEDVEFSDYYLPKDTMVMYNIWKVLHDDQFWDDPWQFIPSRFLDSSGNLLPPENEKRQRMITFGLGKRYCIGEVLARSRMFMCIVAILQKFSLLPDPQYPAPETDPRKFDVCVVMSAPPYKIVFNPRQELTARVK